MHLLPAWLRLHLAVLLRERGGPLYLAGGVVRDLLRAVGPADIDLTVRTGARLWAARLAELSGGAYVELGRGEDAARVVSGAVTVDFSAFREGAVDILDDLVRRDLTINAMALQIDQLLLVVGADSMATITLLDPTGGQQDLAAGRIRAAGPEAFTADPLRLLRVFRFAACLGFHIEAGTLAMVRQQCGLIVAPAPERISHELDLIMASGQAYRACAQMAKVGLLGVIFPELQAGAGMLQPASHHLDVLGHSLDTLRHMEELTASPVARFPGHGQRLAAFLAIGRNRVRLKWAALLHDLGKPVTCMVNAERGDRITFHNHDRVGADLFRAVARRLRWGNDDTEQVARLISAHMRPFHLANVARSAPLTLRAAIRLVRAAGDSLPGLFLLAMADALAGQGSERLAGMEAELVDLYDHLERVRLEHVAPVQTGPPLLTGWDLIEHLKLAPSPLFKEILAAVEEARMEGTVKDADGALQLARSLAPVQTSRFRRSGE
ncbi:MAG: HD domain-containing protein [Desulfobulbus sp.]|jgi:poly(A) polymerase|nr:HD domain-containing protein [Desulfobulbus sp.]